MAMDFVLGLPLIAFLVGLITSKLWKHRSTSFQLLRLFRLT